MDERPSPSPEPDDPPEPADPLAVARAVADRVAGGTYAQLRAREDAARRAVDAWHAAFEAALARTAWTARGGRSMSVAEAARALGRGEPDVRELVRRGRLRAVPGPDDPTRVVRADVERLQAGGVADPLASPPGAAAVPLARSPGQPELAAEPFALLSPEERAALNEAARRAIRLAAVDAARTPPLPDDEL